jgi:putative transposase
VESLDRAADRMLFAALPGYTAGPAGPRSDRRGRTEEAVSASLQDFTAEVLAWRNWWNTAHRPRALPGRTPLEARQADPTPVTDIPAAGLWAFALEDDGRPRKLTGHGVSWRGRTYAAAWMAGQAGRRVRVRYMPHHDHEMEVCDARGRHLGPGAPSGRGRPRATAGAARGARSAPGACAPTRRAPNACAADGSPPPPARSPPSGWEPSQPPAQADRELAAGRLQRDAETVAAG